MPLVVVVGDEEKPLRDREEEEMKRETQRLRKEAEELVKQETRRAEKRGLGEC